ncbi:type VI secretion system accessory protein TagJ [Paraburkholderia diazotrophica]|uniref:type VI secretion system accessory protein TagJ n=1 Tax=Paraburkholderia diazotrophica TaxID=667676 RepID=UPI003171CA5E
MTVQPTLPAQERARLFPAAEIEAAEAAIRSQPAQAVHRWRLFQWLCVTCEWERAVQQLQVYAQLDRGQTPVVQVCRDLIRAERTRARVMAGQQQPGFVVDDMPLWMRAMLAALEFTGQGQMDAADDARERALDLAPLVAGHSGDIKFEWIGDSDTRLGPICEFITAGRYRWLSLADIAAWQIERPATLLDLIWAPCMLTLGDGTQMRGFMPARYPDSGDTQGDDRDALLLARRTAWRELGRTGVIASGRKTWATSTGDFDLHELARCSFTLPAEGAAVRHQDTTSGAPL